MAATEPATDIAPGPVSATRPRNYVPYDAVDDDVSTAPFVKLKGGPCNVNSGRLTGAEWSSQPGLETAQQHESVWKQT